METQQAEFFVGLRVKLKVSVAIAPYPEWMCGYHDFDLARFPLSDRWAFMTNYQGAVQIDDIGTIAGVHRWPERVDYLIGWPSGLYSIIPSDGAEFYDYGNIILVPKELLPKDE